MKYPLRLLIVLSFFSCMETPVEVTIPAEKILCVSGLLVNNHKQYIYLFRGRSAQDSLFNDYKHNSQKIGISNALLTLQDGDNTLIYREDSVFVGRYILDNWKPAGNQRYTIRIKHRDYPDIETSTLFPDTGDFNIRYAFNNAGDLELSWDTIYNSYGYAVYVNGWVFGFFGPEPVKKYYWRYWGGMHITPTERLTLSKNSLLNMHKIVDLKIIISALDKNYYNWRRYINRYNPLDFHFIDYGNYSTIDNAVGYIGSAYSDSIIIRRH